MKSNLTPQRLVLIAAATLLALTRSFSFGAETGVSDSEIKIGICNALTGNSSALGSGVTAGARVYFDKVNKAGGVQGRQIKLISCDDGYEPDRTVAETTKLIEQEQVFSLFGYVGTPTSSAILPQLTKSGIPFFGPFTGAEFLRNPVKKNIFNVRASYFDETEGLIEHLTTDLGLKSIGLFIQDDAYGAAGEAGVLKALRKRNLTVAGKGTYKRNTVEVDAGLAAMQQANPQAVIQVGTYKACAAFIKKAKAGGFAPVFCNISFVGTAALVKELGADGEGVFVSQVMPSPLDLSVPIVKQYTEDMQAAGQTELDHTSLEGYVDAAVFVEGLKRMSGSPTRAALIASFEALKAEVGGFNATFSASDHQALDTVYFTVIKGGKAVPVSKF